MGKFEGKVVLVTGAAESEGRSRAVHFAQEGADIVAVDICQKSTVEYDVGRLRGLKETARLVEAEGRRIHAVQADVREFEQLERVVWEAVAKFGRLDIVIISTGVRCSSPAASLTY